MAKKHGTTLDPQYHSARSINLPRSIWNVSGRLYNSSDPLIVLHMALCELAQFTKGCQRHRCAFDRLPDRMTMAAGAFRYFALRNDMGFAVKRL